MKSMKFEKFLLQENIQSRWDADEGRENEGRTRLAKVAFILSTDTLQCFSISTATDITGLNVSVDIYVY